MSQMAPPLWRMPPASRDPARRSVGVVAVLLLHLIAIAALLQASLQRAPAIRQAAREITFWFLPAPKQHTQPRKPPPKPQTKRKAPAIAPMRSIPDYRNFVLPPVPQTTAPAEQEHSGTLQGLGLPLFACAPENLDKLSPEARAKCMPLAPLQTPDDSVDYADHTDKSKGAERWARGKARKNAPLLLPCANSQNIIMTVLGALPCLANGAINGFDLDAAQGYADRPSPAHVPNNGDPPPIYREPDH